LINLSYVFGKDYESPVVVGLIMIEVGCRKHLIGIKLVDDNQAKLSKSAVREIIKEDFTVAGGL
jgi:hypothetical protein